MSRSNVPNAWDDDWTTVADQSKPEVPAPKLSKAEKRAQHQQLQQELWSSAESPSRNLWLESKGALPLKQEFVPSMTVLSRRPAPTLAKRDGANGTLQQDDEDSEEEARKKRDADLAERQQRAKLEREEKVRKYAEARERIMGSSAPASPKPNADSRESSQGRSDNRRQRGNKQGQARHSPRAGTPAGQLFDPDDMTRRLPRQAADGAVTPREGEPLRQPRGPDNTGRGGFGFGSHAESHQP